jgi:ParB-like nuclease domain
MNAANNPEVEWQVRRIPLDAIRVDPTVQQRAAGTSQDIIDEYSEAMRNGVAFPPIVVFGYADGPFYLGDGFHRLKALLLARPDADHVECDVHPGDRDDALLFACGANSQHGLRRSRSDKEKAVTTLIDTPRWSGWSDREIARQCGVSHPFVAAVRRELETFPDAGAEQAAATETTPAPNTAAPVRRRTVRRGGRRYKLNTARIGRGRSHPRGEVAKLKRALERLQGTLSGASEGARKTFVEQYREEIMALAYAPEPPNSEPPNPEPSNPEAPNPEPSNPDPPTPEPPTPEAPSPAEAESSTVPPPRARAYGIRNPSRLTRGSAPNKSHKNAPGRHRFSSDNQPPKSKRGRPPGSRNKLSRDLREDIMEAAERVGRDGEGEGGVVGFLMWLARTEPKSYAMLLRAGMPAEIRATMTLKPMLTRDEALGEMRARGLPTEWIEHLTKVDDELGPDDDPNPYDHEVIDLKPEPPAASAE